MEKLGQFADAMIPNRISDCVGLANHSMIVMSTRSDDEVPTQRSMDVGPQLALVWVPGAQPTVTTLFDVAFPEGPGGRYNAGPGTLFYQTGWSSTICQVVAAMQAFGASLDLQGFYGVLTSNSNTFVSMTLASVDINLPAPPNSPGWGGPFFRLPGGTVAVPIWKPW